MSEKEKVELVEEVQEPKQQVEEPKKTEEKPKLERNDEGMIKLDLRKNKKDAVQEQTTDEVPVRDESKVSGEVQKENNEKTDEKFTKESKKEEEVVLEEVVETEEDKKITTPTVETKTDKVVEEKVVEQKLPEDIDKLVKFMEETGGTLEDYVNINKDYSSVDDNTLLRQYYQQTKKHLTSDEINFLIEDKFSYDENVDDEKDVFRKKLAFKEEVANARQQLVKNKEKYYADIKAGANLNSEQQKAIEFFNRYNKEQKESSEFNEKQRNAFNQKTDEVFNQQFKGFEYNVGEKKYRFKVNNPFDVKHTQSDINNFVGKFLDKNNMMSDAKGYHKSLFTAMNPDAVAKHFYEQGRSDAVKDSIAKAKNVSMDPRKSLGNEVQQTSGIRVAPVNLDNSSDFKIKIGNRKP